MLQWERALLVAYVCVGLARPTPGPDLARDLSRALGVPIAFVREPIAETMPDGRVRYQSPAHPAELAEVLPRVLAGLERYPAAVRDRVIRRVEIGRYLYEDDEPLGGWASVGTGTVHLAVRSDQPVEQLLHTLHHEVAHLLYYDDPSLQDAWGHDGAPRALIPGHSHQRTRALHRDGFLNAYASTSPAEDFAECAAHLMADPVETELLAARHPYVARKLALIRSKYAALGVRLPR